MTSKQVEARFNMFRTAVAVGIAIVIAAALIFWTSETPLEAIRVFTVGPLESFRRMGNVIELMMPLCMGGCAISIMYSATNSARSFLPASCWVVCSALSLVFMFPCPKAFTVLHVF